MYPALKDKLMSAAEAAELIHDGDIIGDAGMDETVTMTGGDQELSSWRQEGALAEELTATVIFSLEPGYGWGWQMYS